MNFICDTVIQPSPLVDGPPGGGGGGKRIRLHPPGQSQSGIKMTVWNSSFRIGMFPSK